MVEDKESEWKWRFEQFLKIAKDEGVIITVHLKPLTPLAMGHYEQVVDVRPVRELATHIVRGVE